MSSPEDGSQEEAEDRIASYVSVPADAEDKRDLVTLLLWIMGFILLALITFKVVMRQGWLITLVRNIL